MDQYETKSTNNIELSSMKISNSVASKTSVLC
jgi:hypothetical protein